MDDFEGSLVLEKLATMNLVDDFYEAVDSDNIEEIISILESADFDDETIQIVLRKISG